MRLISLCNQMFKFNLEVAPLITLVTIIELCHYTINAYFRAKSKLLICLFYIALN